MKDLFIDTFRRLRRKLAAFRETPRGQKIINYLSYLLQATVIGVILYQLSGIGWRAFWEGLPAIPSFYLLFLAIYFLLPFSEALAYKLCWNTPYFSSIPIFLKKLIFNKDLMGYSGEVVLMHWATKKIPRSRRQLFRDIRDMNIASSAASTIVAAGLLLFLILTGRIEALELLFNGNPFGGAGLFDYLIGGGLAALAAALAYRFRNYLFAMPVELASKVFLIHAVRMMVIYALTLLQWHLVMPEIALEIWFTFLSIRIVISRIPFLPSQELVSTSTNIELARILSVPLAPISGLFLAHDVLAKILNLGFYLLFGWREQTGKEITAGVDPAD